MGPSLRELLDGREAVRRGSVMSGSGSPGSVGGTAWGGGANSQRMPENSPVGGWQPGGRGGVHIGN